MQSFNRPLTRPIEGVPSARRAASSPFVLYTSGPHHDADIIDHVWLLRYFINSPIGLMFEEPEEYVLKEGASSCSDILSILNLHHSLQPTSVLSLVICWTVLSIIFPFSRHTPLLPSEVLYKQQRTVDIESLTQSMDSQPPRDPEKTQVNERLSRRESGTIPDPVQSDTAI